MAIDSTTNFARSQLTSGAWTPTSPLNGGTFTLATGANFPTSNFYVVLDQEIVLCSSRASNTFTLDATNGRGQRGTAAASHNNGVDVFNGPLAHHISESAYTTQANTFSQAQTFPGSTQIDATGAILLGATVAATGKIRLANSSNVTARNAGNTADLILIGADASNNVVVGAGAPVAISGGATIGTQLSVGTFQVDTLGRIGLGAAPLTTAMQNILGTAAHPGNAATLYGISSRPTFPATTVTSAFNFYAQTLTAASTPLTSAYGYYYAAPSLGGSSTINTVIGLGTGNLGGAGITNAYGVFIPPITGASGFSVAGRFDTSDDGALWLGGDVAGTTAAGGIVWGSGQDVNLYRLTANRLRTDDNFDAGVAIFVGVSPAAGGTINVPNNAALAARNAANSADINLIYADASNVINIGGTKFQVDTSGRVAINGTTGNLVSMLVINGTHPYGSAGTVYGVASQFITPTTATGSTGLYTGLTTAAGVWTLTTGTGLTVGTPSLGASSAITNLHGILVNDQRVAGVSNAYGITVAVQSGLANIRSDGGGSTANLWLRSDTPSAAGGIAFGVSADANLYRGAANQLKTDDDFQGVTATFAGTGNNPLTLSQPASTGITATHILMDTANAGYGGGFSVRSREVGTNTQILEGTIEIEGENTWASVATASSFMRFSVASAGTLTERMRLTSLGLLKVGTNAGTTGQIGIPNNVAITARNAANSGDINLIYADASDRTVLGTSNGIRIDSTGRIGTLGQNPVADRLLYIGGFTHPDPAAETLYGIVLNPTVPSTAAGQTYYGVYSQVRTAAAAFTLANGFSFRAVVPSVGAGSTLTAWYGFYADVGTGAGTAYGVFVEAQTAATSVAIRANGGVTANLHLASDTASTAGGIAFGATVAANQSMYRRASGVIEAGGTFSAVTGFQVNHAAAATGHYLRGDGTRFVDSTIPLGDLPAGVGLLASANTWTAIQQWTGQTGLPAASSGGQVMLAAGFASPVSARMYIGDGTGWSFRFSTRTGSADTDRFTFLDTGILSASSGYQVGGAAASGQYLRGDGTKAVFSALLAGDMPTSGIPNVAYVNVANQFTLANTFTLASGRAVSVRSGNAAQWAGLEVGRTGVEFDYAVSNGSGTFFTGDAAGDAILRLVDTTKTLHLGLGTNVNYAGLQMTSSRTLLTNQLVLGTNAGTMHSYPHVVSYDSQNTVVGAIIIHTPLAWSANQMTTLNVRGYIYGGATEINFQVSFYPYSGNSASSNPINVTFTDYGNDGLAKRIGVDAGGKIAVSIGDIGTSNYFARLWVDAEITQASTQFPTGWSVDTTTTAGFGWTSTTMLQSSMIAQGNVTLSGIGSGGVSSNGYLRFLGTTLNGVYLRYTDSSQLFTIEDNSPTARITLNMSTAAVTLAGTQTIQGSSSTITNAASNNPYYMLDDGTSKMKMQMIGTTYGWTGTQSNHPYVLGTNNTERVRILTSGVMQAEYGITNTPAYAVGTIQEHFLGYANASPTAWAISLAYLGDASYVNHYLTINARVTGGTRSAPTLTSGGGNGGGVLFHDPLAGKFYITTVSGSGVAANVGMAIDYSSAQVAFGATGSAVAAQVLIGTNATTTPNLIARSVSSQTADPVLVQDSSGFNVARIDTIGNLMGHNYSGQAEASVVANYNTTTLSVVGTASTIATQGTASATAPTQLVAVLYTTAASTNSGAGAQTNSQICQPSHDPEFTARFRTDTSAVTTVRYWVALTNADLTLVQTPGSGNHVVGFRYDSSMDTGSTWRIVTCNGTSATVTDTTIPIAANTDYKFRVTRDPATGNWRGEINTLTTPIMSATLPSATVGLSMQIVCTTLAASARTVAVGFMRCRFN